MAISIFDQNPKDKCKISRNWTADKNITFYKLTRIVILGGNSRGFFIIYFLILFCRIVCCISLNFFLCKTYTHVYFGVFRLIPRSLLIIMQPEHCRWFKNSKWIVTHGKKMKTNNFSSMTVQSKVYMYARARTYAHW